MNTSHQKRIEILGLSIRWNSQVYDGHIIDWYFLNKWLLASGQWWVNISLGKPYKLLHVGFHRYRWHVWLFDNGKKRSFFR
jgi:hypothetical protein